MYTEAIVERTMFAAPLFPEVLSATTTVNSGSVDFAKVNRGCFNFKTGTFGGTSPTLSAALQVQVSVDNASWVNSTASNVTATVTQATKQQPLEIRGDNLAQQSAADGVNYRYARLQAVCTIGGTSPTIPVEIDAFGQDAKQGPGSQSNDASVLTPLQALST